MTTWFTADLHIGHRAIIDHCWRPFASVEEMNEALVANWNARVQPGDRVWVLGDVVMGNIRLTLPTVERLSGEKYLIPGNHDACWMGHKKWRQGMRKYEAVGFTLLHATLDHGCVHLAEADAALGATVLASHFPYAGDHTEEMRYTEHRPADDGHILLHGHVHGAWKIRGRQINVGVDVWGFSPVSLGELATAFRGDRA